MAAAPPWNRSRSLALHAGIVMFVFAGAYWTAAGGGFISDDFRWILESRVRGGRDIARLLTETTGFYRPLVSLTFAALEGAAGLDPRPYGVATFVLALMCAAAVALFAASLGLRGGAALLAASLWLLNPHGINMAVLWISGLAALSLVFFSTTSAIAVQKGRPFLAAALFLAALLSKEEAVLLPIPLLLLSWQRHGTIAAQTGVLAAGLFSAETIYFWLRSGSDAMTPANAPAYYRFTFELGSVAASVLQYADRALTISALVVLIVLAVVRAKPSLDARERGVLLVAAVWVVMGFAITIFLPVRSSLYLLLPSVGATIAASTIISALWRSATPRQRRGLTGAALVLPLLLLPILKARTERWTELMRVTRLTTEAVCQGEPATHSVLFVDDRTRRDNLENAFRALLPDALELYCGERPEVWMVPAPSDAGRDQIERAPDSVRAAWRYRDGRIERVDPGGWIGSESVRMR